MNRIENIIAAIESHNVTKVETKAWQLGTIESNGKQADIWVSMVRVEKDNLIQIEQGRYVAVENGQKRIATNEEAYEARGSILDMLEQVAKGEQKEVKTIGGYEEYNGTGKQDTVHLGAWRMTAVRHLGGQLSLEEIEAIEGHEFDDLDNLIPNCDDIALNTIK